MSLQDVALIGTTIVAIATAVWTGVKTLADRRAGVRSTEHTARRDTVADRDALIDQLQEQATAANVRAEASDTAKRQAEAEARSAERELRAELEYTQLLRDHIYRRREPPPPSRPTT